MVYANITFQGGPTPYRDLRKVRAKEVMPSSGEAGSAGTRYTRRAVPTMRLKEVGSGEAHCILVERRFEHRSAVCLADLGL